MGASGPCKEGFETEDSYDNDDQKDQNLYIIKAETEMAHQIYPACPNIQCPNENAFNKDNNDIKQGQNKQLGTLSSWSVITDYAPG
jgi:hypothetical protein